jgi:hypothetical protein
LDAGKFKKNLKLQNALIEIGQTLFFTVSISHTLECQLLIMLHMLRLKLVPLTHVKQMYSSYFTAVGYHLATEFREINSALFL